MDDFIKRSDALKVIESANRMVSKLLEATMQLCMTMNSIAAADVVPVVRCGECKHWFDNGTGIRSCDRDALLRRRDFFCADGEKKDGDNG